MTINILILHLVSLPVMRESIQEGLKEDISECSKKLDWKWQPSPLLIERTKETQMA
ncbi:MAG: hypothetical protein HKK67_07675 [Chlorobiaceae bacterium]|nr:hypothetical protein [Chlorobiaceae bacterium]